MITVVIVTKIVLWFLLSLLLSLCDLNDKKEILRCLENFTHEVESDMQSTVLKNIDEQWCIFLFNLNKCLMPWPMH